MLSINRFRSFPWIASFSWKTPVYIYHSRLHCACVRWRWFSNVLLARVAQPIRSRQMPTGKTHAVPRLTGQTHANNEVGSRFELLKIARCHRLVKPLRIPAIWALTSSFLYEWPDFWRKRCCSLYTWQSDASTLWHHRDRMLTSAWHVALKNC